MVLRTRQRQSSNPQNSLDPNQIELCRNMSNQWRPHAVWTCLWPAVVWTQDLWGGPVVSSTGELVAELLRPHIAIHRTPRFAFPPEVLLPCLHRSEPSPIYNGAFMNRTFFLGHWSVFVVMQCALSCGGAHCHQGVLLPWGVELGLQQCVSNCIHMNICPAEHCIVTKWSVLFTSPLRPFSAVTDRCIL